MRPQRRHLSADVAKGLVMLGLTSLCMTAYGQGAISFRNLGTGAGGTTVNARVFAEDGVTPLAGTWFFIQLWYGPANTPIGSLTPLASPILTFNTGLAVGYTSTAPTVQIPGVAIGGVATLMWRVWDITPLGFPPMRRGESIAFQSPPLGDNLNPATIPVMQGLQSFFLIPEPSICALLALGAGALLFRRRR